MFSAKSQAFFLASFPEDQMVMEKAEWEGLIKNLISEGTLKVRPV